MSKNFIMVDRTFWRGDQCMALSPNAKVVLIDIQYGYTGKNNGKIRYSGRDAGLALNASKETGYRAINELRAAGLIEPTTLGSFTSKVGGRHKTATEWRLKFL